MTDDRRRMTEDRFSTHYHLPFCSPDSRPPSPVPGRLRALRLALCCILPPAFLFSRLPSSVPRRLLALLCAPRDLLSSIFYLLGVLLSPQHSLLRTKDALRSAPCDLLPSAFLFSCLPSTVPGRLRALRYKGNYFGGFSSYNCSN